MFILFYFQVEEQVMRCITKRELQIRFKDINNSLESVKILHILWSVASLLIQLFILFAFLFFCIFTITVYFSFLVFHIYSFIFSRSFLFFYFYIHFYLHFIFSVNSYDGRDESIPDGLSFQQSNDYIREKMFYQQYGSLTH